MDPLKKTTGPCIVLAGAGTGKTRLIVEKVKYLIENKIYPPEKIVGITFSNEAANSLLSRIRKVVPLSQEPIIKTFHSFSAHLLKEHLSDEKRNFHTLTPEDAKILIHTTLRVPPLNCHRYIDTIGKAKDIGITISSLKTHLSNKIGGKSLSSLKEEFDIVQTEMLRANKNNSQKKILSSEAARLKELIDFSKFIILFEAYEKIKLQKNFFDYSDLNNEAVTLLEKNPLLSRNFSYVIVDEFQDTNRIQLELLRLLCPHGNITVVGDMNQSIYRFRGAYEANIERFKKIFNASEKDVFTLDKSYRSPNKILTLAHTLIRNNYDNDELCLRAFNARGEIGQNIHLTETKNGQEEARRVIEIIKEKISLGEVPEEICIMARTHQQLALIKKSLSDAKIEFHSVGQESLLKQSSIKKIISYLSIVSSLVNKNDKGWNAWWDLTYEEKFSKEDFIKISEFLKTHKETENYNVKIFSLLENLPLSEDANNKIKIILARIKSLIPESSKKLEEIISSAYVICGLSSEHRTRAEKEVLLNVTKFIEFAKKYEERDSARLDDFVHYLEILYTLGIPVETARIEDRGVRLMTAHSTKGLEYKIVILTNLAQKRFPIERISRNKFLPDELIQKEENVSDIEEYERKHQLSEERRLCYVSFTRSKSELYLTFAQEYGGKKHQPSQFLQEINYKENPEVDYTIDLEEKSNKASEAIQLSEENSDVLRVKEKTLSPSALMLFEECQKKFEYKYVYNMPEKITTSWEALKTGSFIHLVLEKGVRSNFKKLEDFINIAKDLKTREEWDSVDLDEVLPLLKIFYSRNVTKYSEKSLTEKILFTGFSGLHFMGVADRIDIHEDGLEIIDYKTGKTIPSGKERNWQLGYYALAAKPLGKVKKLTLDVFQNEIPLEFSVKENGDVISLNSNRLAFNLHEVEAEFVEVGKKIKYAYSHGFSPCAAEKNCEFCNEYVY